MNSFVKSLLCAVVLGSAGVAHAESTVIYHSDGTRSLVVTEAERGGSDVYRDYGSGWQWHGFHGDAYSHADVVDRRTGSQDSVGDYREPRQVREPREPSEPSGSASEPREKEHWYERPSRNDYQ